MPHPARPDSAANAPHASRRTFYGAVVAYALWLVFLAVLASMQRAL